MMRRCLGAVLRCALIPVLLIMPLATGAADEVRVQALERGKFGRIVMTWGQPVGFSAKIVERRLVARFDRPFVGPLQPAVQRLGNYLTGARQTEDGHRAEFSLRDDYRLVAYARGKEVVFDLLPKSRSAEGPVFSQIDRVRSAERKTPILKVRVGRHKEYTRLVFDWPKVVPYKVDQSSRSVSVRFEAPARIDLAGLRRQLPPSVSVPAARVDSGALVVSFRTGKGLIAEHFRIGARVVVDFKRSADVKAAARRPNKASKPSGKKVAVRAPKPAAQKPTRGPDDPPPPATAPVSKVGSAPLAEKMPEPPVEAAPESRPAAAAPADKGKVSAKATGKTVSLEFDWPETVGAAVFERAPFIWIVFDRRAQINLAPLRQAARAMVSSVEQLPVSEGTVLRVRPLPGVSPQVYREANNWVITFRRWPITAQIPIRIQVRPEAVEGAELVLPITEFGRIFTVSDPGVGDRLMVATTRAPGQGVNGRRRYAEFDILPSAQGVAIAPRSETIALKNVGNRGVAVIGERGLHVSAVALRQDGKGFLGPRIFNFSNWSGGDVDTVTAAQVALRAVVEVPKKRRDDARLDLARFYFARGLATEAFGVLRRIEAANPVLSSQPEFRAMIGATRVYMGRYPDARKDLLDPRLDKFQEIALWRGSMFLQAGELKKAAAQFRTGDPVLADYPDPIRTRLALDRVEAGMADLDVSSATVWLERLDKASGSMLRKDVARLRYNQGVLARKSRNLDRAVTIWGDVKKSKDRWNAARAEFALIDLGLQQETVSVSEAAKRLERLRYQWRGDRLELAVLKMLGEIYLGKGDYRKGLSTLRTAVTYFPTGAPVKAIAQSMTDAFKSLHLEGGADKLPPLRALALYDDFRELTPAGPEGDRMIQRLSDRLVSVDLLDRAADLLAHQVRYRLKGEEKARVGAKLAIIYLLDRNPKGALSALRNSFQPNLPQDVEDDRRRIRAKATLELERYEEAIALLAGDVSTEADLLRADIYWNTQNYSEAAKVLQRLSGDPLSEGGYDQEQARFILSWAVALRLKRDEAGVKLLRELYGPGMAKSDLADTFAFIASPSGDDSKNIESITRKMAEADHFESFLKNYRARLIQPPIATGGPGRSGRQESPPSEAKLPPAPPPPQS
jgi:tetratricopeptide (TPR) repeat protein